MTPDLQRLKSWAHWKKLSVERGDYSSNKEVEDSERLFLADVTALIAAVEERDRLREALEFYAACFYEKDSSPGTLGIVMRPGGGGPDTRFAADRGKRARAALEVKS